MVLVRIGRLSLLALSALRECHIYVTMWDYLYLFVVFVFIFVFVFEEGIDLREVA